MPKSFSEIGKYDKIEIWKKQWKNVELRLH